MTDLSGTTPIRTLLLPRHHWPAIALGLLAFAGILHGPVAQLPDYHAFDDQHALFGIPYGKDVLSNLPFVLVALWGWHRLAPRQNHPLLTHAWVGYRLFLVGLLLTALGSTFYHLAPDNARLVWDRLPIALACGGLLAASWADAHRRASRDGAAWLALAAVVSVAWWHFTELDGHGDLRPYLMLQLAPMLLIPLWQMIYRAEGTERRAFGGALLLYAVAKFAELNDHAILAVTGVISGHTLKHLLAAAAAGMIARSLMRRTRDPASCPFLPDPGSVAPAGNSQLKQGVIMFQHVLRILPKALSRPWKARPFRALTLLVGELMPAPDAAPERLRARVLELRGEKK